MGGALVNTENRPLYGRATTWNRSFSDPFGLTDSFSSAGGKPAPDLPYVFPFGLLDDDLKRARHRARVVKLRRVVRF